MLDSTPYFEQGGGVVGFKDEVSKIIDELTGGPKRLHFISIVGMAGIGKTTLAKEIYAHRLVAKRFYYHAWISISGVYRGRDLLIGIIRSLQNWPLNRDRLCEMDDFKLLVMLNHVLKGRRFLIVIDDLCSIEACADLRRSIPNGGNGSRVMLTTRISEVALRVSSGFCKTHYLGFLSKEESWDLLKAKVFGNQPCPPGLMKVGKIIAAKCEGLPSTIAAVARLLADTEDTDYCWEEVEESLSTYIAGSDSIKFVMNSLELNYNHLPDRLKPLFLYFGVFSKDFEISVSKLIWLWIAEGFVVRRSNGRAKPRRMAGIVYDLEGVAEDYGMGRIEYRDLAEDLTVAYLMDLIERFLVIVASRRSDGRVKSCRMAGMLHDLCLRKAKEVNFLEEIECEPVSSLSSSSSSSRPTGNKVRRFHITHSGVRGNISFKELPNVLTKLSFDPTLDGYSSLISQFKLLRVLDLEDTPTEFLQEIGELDALRYLSLQVSVKKLPSSLAKLQKLQTLIVKGLLGYISIEFDIHTLIGLRHLRIDPGVVLEFSQSSSTLDKLQTISTPSFQNLSWNWLRSTPNLRKLRCYSRGFGPTFEGLEFLCKLKTLNMCSDRQRKAVCLFDLPMSLQRLSLSNFRFDGRLMSKLSRLPNLEVLTLLNVAFEEEWWDEDTSWGSFIRLRFLKLDSLNIVNWTSPKKIKDNIDIWNWGAARYYLPRLERLVLNRCMQLKEIPPSFGYIPTLQMMELRDCSKSAVESAKFILKKQRDKGNDQLSVLISSK